MRSIKELEFDRAMGKLSPKDFDEMAGRLRARAIMLMKQLDEGGSAYREIIERELTARLGPARLPGFSDESAPERRVRRPPSSAAGAWRSAGGHRRRNVRRLRHLQRSDAAFCKRCGTKLREVQS